MPRYLLILLLPIGLAACGGGAQMIAGGEAPVIRQGESMVVFMRSTFVGSAIAASVFDVTGAETQFIGILNNNTKIAYPVKPGQSTFMVVSEAADFMQVTVAAGRTYYALVTPRPGMWKARFSFRPVRQGELGGAEFAGWSSATQFVANSPQTLSWAAQNSADVNSKRSQYWPEWTSKPDVQRASQTLNAEDGKPTQALAAAPLAALEPSSAAAAPAAALALTTAPRSRLPQRGDAWRYRLTEFRGREGERQRRYDFTVESASATEVVEKYSIDGARSRQWKHSPGAYLVVLGTSVFSPYLGAFQDLAAQPALEPAQLTDPMCSGQTTCDAKARVVGREVVKVPAGTFEAIKVTVDHGWRGWRETQTISGASPGGRQLHIWYAPAVKRAVKFSSRLTGRGASAAVGNFDLELESYKLD